MKVIRRRKKGKWFGLAILLFLLASYCYWTLGRPLPPIPSSNIHPSLSATAPAGSLAWPGRGQAAASIVGLDLTETHGQQIPVPIASTAKLITALTILHDKPLKPGEAGPLISLSANDVALYQAYAARGGSTVPVAAGEQISQYQMLQAMLIPSANNMADSLAIWAYGSLPVYTAAAQQYLTEIGLANTKVGTDASGLAPTTISTARDLAKLGKLAMQNPVIAQIVGQNTATGLPVVDTIRTTNTLLGNDHVIGIKTGTSDEAGGVFISASRITVNDKPLTIVTAIAGEADKQAVMASSQTLLRSAQANFKTAQVIKAGTVISRYDLPWGGRVEAIANQDLSVKIWAGSRLQAFAETEPLPANARAGQRIGILKTPNTALSTAREVPLTLSAAPTKPTVWWRLTHPAYFL